MPRFSFVLSLLCALAVAPVARATPPTRVPVIEAGREADVLALVAPFEPLGNVTDTWSLVSVGIEMRLIRYSVADQAGSRAALVLRHPSTAPGAREKSPSFALEREGPDVDAATAALDALAQAVQRNDQGSFWTREARAPTAMGEAISAARARRTATVWLVDGLLLSLAALAVLAFLLWRLMGEAPRWLRWGLPGLVLLAAAFRLALSPVSLFAPWPWVRVPPLADAIFNGPVLAWLSALTGAEIGLLDVVSTSQLGLALVAVPVAFGFARALGLGHRPAFAAAAAATVLPTLIRFAQGDVGILLSMVTAGLAFMGLRVALADRSRVARTVALVLVVPLAAAACVARPLDNYLVPLLLLAFTAGFGAGTLPWPRRLLGGALVAAPALAVFLLYTAANAPPPSEVGVAEALGFAAQGLVLPRFNTLLMPSVTPPVFLLLALAGAVAGWRGGARRAVTLLTLWIVGFIAAHAVILDDSPMVQARYHLHVALPFVALVGVGFMTVARWRRWLGAAIAVYALAVPLVHQPAIHAKANEQHEADFVMGASRTVPPGCVVIEYTAGLHGDHGARFGRLGTKLQDGRRTATWRSVPVGTAFEPNAPLPEVDLAALPTAAEGRKPCVFLFEGLPCLAVSAPSTPEHPGCVRLPGTRLVEVESTTFPNRQYDPNLKLRDTPAGTPVKLTLYRVE